MVRIFISYRREDSSGYAGRLYDGLQREFGHENVFMDVDNLRPGEKFADAVKANLSQCDILLVLIARPWLRANDQQEKARIFARADFVRFEIQTALDRKIRIVPVLLDGVSLPRPQDLPPPIRALVGHQAIELRHNSWGTDVSTLIGAIKSVQFGQPAQIEKMTSLPSAGSVHNAHEASGETPRVNHPAFGPVLDSGEQAEPVDVPRRRLSRAVVTLLIAVVASSIALAIAVSMLTSDTTTEPQSPTVNEPSKARNPSPQPNSPPPESVDPPPRRSTTTEPPPADSPPQAKPPVEGPVPTQPPARQATLTGTVTDSSGGVLPGVTIEAASPALSNKVKSATTNDSGQYRIVGLPLGIYEIRVVLDGKILSRQRIEVQQSQTVTNIVSSPAK